MPKLAVAFTTFVMNMFASKPALLVLLCKQTSGVNTPRCQRNRTRKKGSLAERGINILLVFVLY